MKIKVYTNSWKIGNSKIKLVPDLGWYNKMGTLYIEWLGVIINIHLKNKKIGTP